MKPDRQHAKIPRWQSVAHLLRAQALRMGNQTLLRFEGQNLSFVQVENQTNRLANVLRTLGVQKGNKVAVMMPNGLEYPLSWLAIAKLGAIMIPINTQYRASELEFVLNNAQADIAIAGRQQIEAFEGLKSKCSSLRDIVLFSMGSTISGTRNLFSEMEKASAACRIDGIHQDDLLNLQYTSGTTGFPKACMLSHKYWLQLGQDMCNYARVTAKDVDLTAQPFYYMDPQWNVVLCMIAGIPLVILPRFSASTFWKSVKDNRVTFFYLIATMPVYLLKQPENPQIEKTHNVRLVMCSGIVPQLHTAFEKRWNTPWREVYGSTESGGDLGVPIEDTDSVGSGTVGIPFAGKAFKILDANGNEVRVGEQGELVIRGEPRMLGYYKNRQASAEKIRNGWLHTGDLFTRDEKGYYTIVGRLKDMVRRSGENISTAEVEGVLCEHPAVRAAAVVPVSDELRGEEVKAFIQLQPGESTDPQDIVDFTGSRLAAFKVPRFIQFVDRFSMTPSERIIKRELMENRKNQRPGTYDAIEKKWRSDEI
jgi:acyl-CoA synthetase (AMP-forming)/AMP-acid ligase II